MCRTKEKRRRTETKARGVIEGRMVWKIRIRESISKRLKTTMKTRKRTKRGKIKPGNQETQQ